MAERFGLHKRIFSGLRSQCMIFNSGHDKNSSAVAICWANFLVKLSDTPRKLVFLNKSYRLYDNSSNTKHKWFRHMKWCFSFTTWYLSSLSVRFIVSKSLTSIWAWKKTFIVMRMTNRLWSLYIFLLRSLYTSRKRKYLVQKWFFVFDDFYSDMTLLFGVESFNDLAKRPLSY